MFLYYKKGDELIILERTVLPEIALYERDSLFLEEKEAWSQLSTFIGKERMKKIKEIVDVNEKEALYKSLWSLYERVMQQKNSMKNIEERKDKCFDRARQKAKKMKQERINMLVAVDSMFCIGKDNAIPWKQPDDLKHVKELTTGNIIILGNNTFKSVGVLPNREMRVLTRDRSLKSSHPNVKYYYNHLDAIKRNEKDNREIFIFGGEKIYELYWNLFTDLYITFVDTIIDGDTFFPLIPVNSFITRECRKFENDSIGKNEFPMTMTHLRKIKSHKLNLEECKKSLHLYRK